MATITISAPEAKSDVVFEAPNNLLDLNIPDVQAKIKDRALAVAVVSKGLKLYAHGKADLGYGIVATIEGQLGG